MLYQLLERSQAEPSAPAAGLENTLGCSCKVTCVVCCQLPFAVAGDEGGWMLAVTHTGEKWAARLLKLPSREFVLPE